MIPRKSKLRCITTVAETLRGDVCPNTRSDQTLLKLPSKGDECVGDILARRRYPLATLTTPCRASQSVHTIIYKLTLHWDWLHVLCYFCIVVTYSQDRVRIDLCLWIWSCIQRCGLWGYIEYGPAPIPNMMACLIWAEPGWYILNLLSNSSNIQFIKCSVAGWGFTAISHLQSILKDRGMLDEVLCPYTNVGITSESTNVLLNIPYDGLEFPISKMGECNEGIMFLGIGSTSGLSIVPG